MAALHWRCVARVLLLQAVVRDREKSRQLKLTLPRRRPAALVSGTGAYAAQQGLRRVFCTPAPHAPVARRGRSRMRCAAVDFPARARAAPSVASPRQLAASLAPVAREASAAGGAQRVREAGARARPCCSALLSGRQAAYACLGAARALHTISCRAGCSEAKRALCPA